jgi:hypothetical protein
MTPVCWSIAERIRNAERQALCHVQGDNNRTLCGILMQYRWEFDVHDDTEAVTCLRCKRILAKGVL